MPTPKRARDLGHEQVDGTEYCSKATLRWLLLELAIVIG